MYEDVELEGTIVLPNIKKIFLADEGKEIADGDLSGADIMVVAADSGCKWLLDFFANPKGKVYKYIAGEFFQREITDKEYKTYKGIFHGTNYGMGIDKLATTAGISYELAKQLREFYFMLNPEVKVWQERIKNDIRTKGYVTNIYGRRGWFLDKNSPTLANQALAFIPQSTIADTINRAWVKIYEEYSEIEVLMQTHDSLTVQYDAKDAIRCRQILKTSMEVPLAYEPVMVIPSDFKTSLISYGDCH